MDEGKSIEIKIVIAPSKFAELIKLMPDHAKGRGEIGGDKLANLNQVLNIKIPY